MPIYATAGESKTFDPAPAGTHHAVCVDVIDRGLHPNKFNPGTTQHKIDIAWQLSEKRNDGKPWMVFKRYTLSLNEKASLRHDLESWRGRPFTPAEEARFDVETVIGANCILSVQHRTSDQGKTFANVMSVAPLLKGMAKIAPDPSYVRVVNRTPESAPSEADAFDSQVPSPEPVREEVFEDSIPF